ncbi:MAG: PDDEXK nuclease domain-containing protein [Candidatus Accumulibacter sp.]|jgi:predicted nuclease of restriction endonuclease-like (RecB) superfamily|nr:PDDEXK nuclease domain-containing protein [Accumulibacter sp.]
MATSKKPMTKKLVPVVRDVSSLKDYPALLAEVKARIHSAQYAALRAVNKELVGLYWDIGRMIVERQKDAKHGAAIAEQLADDLRDAFPDIGGFSRRNVFYMREFYLLYRDDAKVQPLVAQIGWSHNLTILSRCKDAQEREFYLRMTRKFGWSKNVLIHQIDNQSFEKSLLGQTNFDQTLTPALRAQAKLAVKDEYAFDFLELGERHSERELERALIGRIEDFLRAMGGMFAFMGSQYRLEVEGKEYFLDLLLFHRRLRALVAIELKVGEFEPEFVGKMQFYLAALDTQVRQDDENPSIGIILCKEKRRTIVEYALRDARKPIGVATYEITRTLPKKLKDQLPSPEDIARLLENL